MTFQITPEIGVTIELYESRLDRLDCLSDQLDEMEMSDWAAFQRTRLMRKLFFGTEAPKLSNGLTVRQSFDMRGAYKAWEEYHAPDCDHIDHIEAVNAERRWLFALALEHAHHAELGVDGAANPDHTGWL